MASSGSMVRQPRLILGGLRLTATVDDVVQAINIEGDIEAQI